MGKFLRENWLWVALPFIVVLAAMAILILVSEEGDAAAPFIYNVM